ncbi:unnamed protein product [Ilex paraguariensis]|uniref:Uncharacterized protein n=1 Tax=Ilex paraguariensis TaxID=185542 RepID=A0ABC8S8C0_9AQUA
MGFSNCNGESQGLKDLAQQLSLYKPLHPLNDTKNKNPNEDPTTRDTSDKLFPKEFDSKTEFATNPIANQSERLRSNRAAVLICIFEGENGDLCVIFTKRSSTLLCHSGQSLMVYVLDSGF